MFRFRRIVNREIYVSRPLLSLRWYFFLRSLEKGRVQIRKALFGFKRVLFWLSNNNPKNALMQYSAKFSTNIKSPKLKPKCTLVSTWSSESVLKLQWIQSKTWAQFKTKKVSWSKHQSFDWPYDPSATLLRDKSFR